MNYLSIQFGQNRYSVVFEGICVKEHFEDNFGKTGVNVGDWLSWFIYDCLDLGTCTFVESYAKAVELHTIEHIYHVDAAGVLFADGKEVCDYSEYEGKLLRFEYDGVERTVYVREVSGDLLKCNQIDAEDEDDVFRNFKVSKINWDEAEVFDI